MHNNDVDDDLDHEDDDDMLHDPCPELHSLDPFLLLAHGELWFPRPDPNSIQYTHKHFVVINYVLGHPSDLGAQTNITSAAVLGVCDGRRHFPQSINQSMAHMLAIMCLFVYKTNKQTCACNQSINQSLAHMHVSPGPTPTRFDLAVGCVFRIDHGGTVHP
jgi:hypothetical protein